MSINCACDDFGLRTVGEPKDVVCHANRQCQSCGDEIKPSDVMYRYNMYDFELYKTAQPYYMCESCGDLTVSIMEQGFYFQLDDIKGQWREYCEEW